MYLQRAVKSVQGWIAPLAAANRRSMSPSRLATMARAIRNTMLKNCDDLSLPLIVLLINSSIRHSLKKL